MTDEPDDVLSRLTVDDWARARAVVDRWHPPLLVDPDAPRPADVPDHVAASSLLCGSAPPALRGATLTPYYCPVCRGGREDSGCLYCHRVGLVDGEQVRGWPAADVREVPRPPGVRRAPCGDCAFLPGSPESDADPERSTHNPDQPFFCHQGMPDVAGQYQPAAWWAGLPLGYLLCRGWWDLFTAGKVHTRRYLDLEAMRATAEAEMSQRHGRPVVVDPYDLTTVATQELLDHVGHTADDMVEQVLLGSTSAAQREVMSPEELDAVRDGIRQVLHLNVVNVSLTEQSTLDSRGGYVLTASWPVPRPLPRVEVTLRDPAPDPPA